MREPQSEGEIRYIEQIEVILSITAVGEILYQVLSLPVPAGIYGLFIMLVALMSKAVKLESVGGTGNLPMDTMTMMFIPATVGIVECIGEVKTILVPFLLVTAMSTIPTMIVTRHMAQWVIQSKEAKKEK